MHPSARHLRTLFTLVCILAPCLCTADETPPIIGETEHVYTVAPDNTEIRGLAWDETSPDTPRLFVLDGSGQVFTYSLDEKDKLTLLHTYDLSTATGSEKLRSVRGLAFATENDKPVLYFADWTPTGARLWRYTPSDASATSVDLSRYMFRIGNREVFDLACDDGALLVSYDASGYGDQSLRVRRGILRITWGEGFDENPKSVRHLPDAGTAPSHSLATMRLDGVGYLWGTVGDDHVYCADLPTGRGLFFFDRPKSSDDSVSTWGLCFGQDALWVSENVPGPDRIHRVNVTKNLDAPYEGPRVPRRLVMTIQTEPEDDCENPGKVWHYYSRPHTYAELHSQGIWPETETVVDLSDAKDVSIREVAIDPGGDKSSRQILQCVEYAAGVPAKYKSRYEITLWTNPYKKFVYPHRVDRDCTALKGTDYLADDPFLFNLSDKATYTSFIERVRKHIQEKYGVEADMENPYWAARNIVEYIQDNYYYPSRPKRKPAAVDYDDGHYDANPANKKIALSAKPYDKTQIIACSGTSVMVAGAMRHLGFPARWLGTSTQRGAEEFDTNANGLLDAGESAHCSNGHRYSQVWLGSHYGWICFDATPTKPDYEDYDPPPPLQSQWRYMMRAASGHRAPKRLVLNIGSQHIRPLFREFEYDARLAIDNNCGGDQRYNLQGRFEKPELWKLARNQIVAKNVCFVTDVTAKQEDDKLHVTWKLEGEWERIPGATLAVYLQQKTDGGRWHDVARPAKGVVADAGSATVDLSDRHGKQYRVILRREGDDETGGVSGAFDLD